MLKDDFWTRLEREKNRSKISSRQIALQAGISESTFKQWKGNGRLPKAEDLIKICKVLNVSIDYMLTGKDMMYNERVMEIAQACSRASEEDLQLVERILRIEKNTALSKAAT